MRSVGCEKKAKKILHHEDIDSVRCESTHSNSLHISHTSLIRRFCNNFDHVQFTYSFHIQENHTRRRNCIRFKLDGRFECRN